jgi:hypothetical protein
MTPLRARVESHVFDHMHHTDGADTTVGAVAEALGVPCAEIIALADQPGSWLCTLRVPDKPPAQWRLFLEGE